jgi:hypothetical protein
MVGLGSQRMVMKQMILNMMKMMMKKKEKEEEEEMRRAMKGMQGDEEAEQKYK